MKQWEEGQYAPSALANALEQFPDNKTHDTSAGLRSIHLCKCLHLKS